jgi:hypothetical protein
MGFDRTSVIFEFSLKWVFSSGTTLALVTSSVYVYICTCRNMDSRHPLQKQSSVNSSEQNSQDVRKQEANKSHQICSGNTFYRLWDNVLYFVQKCAPRNFTDCLYGYIMVSSAIWKKTCTSFPKTIKIARVRRTSAIWSLWKTHECMCFFFQIARVTKLLLINIHEKIMQLRA